MSSRTGHCACQRGQESGQGCRLPYNRQEASLEQYDTHDGLHNHRQAHDRGTFRPTYRLFRPRSEKNSSSCFNDASSPTLISDVLIIYLL